MFWLTIIYGLGYVFYSTYGLWTLEPKKKFYNRLLLAGTYFPHLVINTIISTIGFYRCNNINPKEAFIFAPLLFLTILPIVNWVVRLLTGRNLIIATRWDRKPKNHKWYIDGLASIILVAVPLISCGMIMNKFRFGHFFV